MGNMDDLEFAPEEASTAEEVAGTWKVLVADDEEEVHRVTRLSLKDFVFEGRHLEILSAYSGEQTQLLLSEHPDTAVLLLDVVMEEEDTGLKIVRWIRETLRNSTVRIILRTGQPGMAPEHKVILSYDINDYKNKTELTIQKLFTTVVSALRSWRDLTTIERNKQGLEMIIRASSDLFRMSSIQKMMDGLLVQLTSLFYLDEHALYTKTSAFTAQGDGGELVVVNATGKFQNLEGKPVFQSAPEYVREAITLGRQKRESYFAVNYSVIYLLGWDKVEHVIFLEGSRRLNSWEVDLIKLFLSNVNLAYDNLLLHQEVERSQREMIYTLGEVTETRSVETSHHVKRVSEYVFLLARFHGLTEEDADLIRVASALHDVGKIGIPDSILHKPEPLDPEEMQLMRTHSERGARMLSISDRPLFHIARDIALQHHEAWNGSGYPQGIKGGNIDLYARMTSIADVFDALANDRVYRKAWTTQQIRTYFQENRGVLFDPRLTDIFLDNFGEFIDVLDLFRENGMSR